MPAELRPTKAAAARFARLVPARFKAHDKVADKASLPTSHADGSKPSLKLDPAPFRRR